METTWRREPQDDFYGPGDDSREEDRVSYLFKGPRVVGRAIARPLPWLTAGARVGWMAPTIDSGTDDRFPSIEERFTDLDAPGLVVQPDFRYADLFGAVDYRDQPRNARSGGYYALTWNSYADLESRSLRFPAARRPAAAVPAGIRQETRVRAPGTRDRDDR